MVTTATVPFRCLEADIKGSIHIYHNRVGELSYVLPLIWLKVQPRSPFLPLNVIKSITR